METNQPRGGIMHTYRVSIRSDKRTYYNFKSLKLALQFVEMFMLQIKEKTGFYPANSVNIQVISK